MQTEPTPSQANFKRSMKVRHLVMLSLGGVIGTGLFSTPATSSPPPAQRHAAGLSDWCAGGMAGNGVSWRTCGGDAGNRRVSRLRRALPQSGDRLHRGWLYWLTDGGARLQPDRRRFLHAVLVSDGAGVAVVPVFCVAIYLLNSVSTRFFAEGSSGSPSSK